VALLESNFKIFMRLKNPPSPLYKGGTLPFLLQQIYLMTRPKTFRCRAKRRVSRGIDKDFLK
jgi:hypothetical protein